MRLQFLDTSKEEIHNGNIVKSGDMVVKGEFNNNGIFGRKIFGTINNDDYSCSCGELTGRFNQGTTCWMCETSVEKNSFFNRTGWIDLGDVYIINPIFFSFIKKIMPIETIIDRSIARKHKDLYSGIGLTSLRENFDLLLDHYYKNTLKKYKKKNIDKYYDFIKNNRDKVFVNKIFVTSIGLRPAVVIQNNLSYDILNTYYNNIIRNRSILNKKGLISDVKEPVLYEIQMAYNDIKDYIFNVISGKSGIVRNFLLGNRFNFSSRSIIVPGKPNHMIDEIHLPYITFLEFYKYNIIHILKHQLGYTYTDASKRVNRAMRVFDEKLYKLATRKIIDEHDTRILINRNPTIDVGSILQLRVTHIKKDIDDYTISIHNNILPLMAGDYDGDVLNIIALIDDNFRDFLNYLNPTHLIISNNNGELDERLAVDRDSVVGLHSYLAI